MSNKLMYNEFANVIAALETYGIFANKEGKRKIKVNIAELNGMIAIMDKVLTFLRENSKEYLLPDDTLSKILPCPVCKDKWLLEVGTSDGDGAAYVKCNLCQSQVRSNNGTLGEAIDLWNRMQRTVNTQRIDESGACDCHFCGSDELILKNNSDLSSGRPCHFVLCDNCEAQGSIRESPEDAVKAWNMGSTT